MTEHTPVLLTEVLEALNVTPGKRYIDATVGAGGHSLAILEKGGELLGIEADSHMIRVAKERLSPNCPTLLHDNFVHIAKLAQANGFVHIDGILMDLGISNLHYEDLKRGFSFRKLAEPLDMRLSTETQQVTAADLLNVLRLDQLIDLFSKVLEKGDATKLSKKVERARNTKRFEKVYDFASIAFNLPEAFLALRMAVNDEITTLTTALTDAYSLLKVGGVLAVITFHSGEDRIVKEFMRSLGQTQKPIAPSEQEVTENSKSRSAKLRIITKNE
jgi:16S rRNA (cytosine1402-N4)-methyltransferase